MLPLFKVPKVREVREVREVRKVPEVKVFCQSYLKK
jgi:hypothetical protein